MSVPAPEQTSLPNFRDFSLIAPLISVLDEIGYENPSPIQAQAIPFLLEGRDMVGQAQTGTGKTAAFALPLLSRINLNGKGPQVLVLAPTRELAIQVAEAFQRYASHMKGFHVLPIYGGQEYNTQIRALKRGVHVVVGTPGRIMDHMRRGTLDLSNLSALVLDEADEMLRMGFIDDVEWILEQTPAKRQIALFSATMPKEIRRIAQTHLNNPQEVTIKVKTATADTIRQRYWTVNGLHKLDALTRILEAETFDGMIIFVRTKTATTELAEKLEARGYAVAALNGDVVQKQRERTVEQLKSGKLDILVATDVVARGLDVERVSHVVNYDIPHDTESYIHRIGRTGRAGRKGDAILFVSPREKRMLGAIEKATRQKIELMELPSTEMINDKRISGFFQRITDKLNEENSQFYQKLLEQYQHDHDVPAIDIAAALANMLQGDQPLLIKNQPAVRSISLSETDRGADRGADRAKRPPRKNGATSARTEEGMERYRIEVGREHNVRPGNIVGAIANEAGLDNEMIGRIDIFDDYSTVDLPAGMPKDVFQTLKRIWVANRQLNISKCDSSAPPPRKFKPASHKKTNKAKPKHQPR